MKTMISIKYIWCSKLQKQHEHKGVSVFTGQKLICSGISVFLLEWPFCISDVNSCPDSKKKITKKIHVILSVISVCYIFSIHVDMCHINPRPETAYCQSQAYGRHGTVSCASDS